MDERFFLAPHKNQTISLKITDQMIAELEDADNIENMDEFYRAKYEAGAFGNKHLLAHLNELRAGGVTSVEGKVAEHVDAEERLTEDGERVMVISSEQEDAIAWKGPWDDDKRGTVLRPTDFELPEVHLQALTINNL